MTDYMIIAAEVGDWTPLINALSTLLIFIISYYTAVKNKLKKLEVTVNRLASHIDGNEEKDGLVKRMQAAEEEFEKLQILLKGVERHLNGDEEKDGLIRRMNTVQAELKGYSDLVKRVDAAEGKVDNTVENLTEVQLRLQENITTAMQPLWKVLEKKADKELLQVQVKHLMDAITRIGSKK